MRRRKNKPVPRNAFVDGISPKSVRPQWMDDADRAARNGGTVTDYGDGTWSDDDDLATTNNIKSSNITVIKNED